MSDDDFRSRDGSDRFDESSSTARDYLDGDSHPIHGTVCERLARIDRVTRTLLADVRPGESRDEVGPLDPDARREARRRLREIRAEASRVGLVLIGPEATMPYRPADGAESEATILARDGSLATTYLGPDPGAFERDRERRREDADEP